MKCCPFLVIRTRISCHIALDTVACAPFSDGKAHEVRQRHQVPQEIRGSEAEGSAVPRTFPGNVFDDPQQARILRKGASVSPAMEDQNAHTPAG
jgi:hypothetical protein